MTKFYLLLSRYLTVLLLFTAVIASAQSRTVSGKITSADDGSAMPGVSIAEKGTSNGVMSDAEGNYTLSVGPNAVLVFSFVGMTTQEIPVGNQTSLSVSLVSDVTQLGEVVIVGYGTVEKKDLTGSVLSFTQKDFNKGVVGSPQELLIGKVAGVQVVQGSGAPTSAASIRIRGGSSLNANNDPLIVIDGFPVDNNGVSGASNPLSTINPNDVQSITVLKDASATAIYGSRASNGVIIITTKKGSDGKLQLSYNGNYSVNTPVKYLDVMNGDEYRAMVNRMFEEGYSGITQATVDLLGTKNTDWQKEVFRTAFSHDHNISVSGTTNNLPYRVSYGYTDQQGILKNTDSKRNSINLNLSPSFLNGRLNATASLKGEFTKNNFGNEGAVGAAVAFDPTQPVKVDDSDYGGFFYWGYPGNPNTVATANPVALIEQTNNQSDVKRFLGSLQVDYAIPFVEGLSANLSTGFDISKGDGYNNNPKNAAFSYGGPGSKVDYTAENSSKLLDLYLTYKKTIENHRFDITGGYSYQSFKRDGSDFARNYDETTFRTYQVTSDGDTVALKRISNPNVLLSFFGRLNYSFNDKYLVTVTLRNDGSSRFAEDNRWGLFPSVALGWRLSNEAFMQNVKAVSNLKLRFSYGITGQQDIGATYPYLALYTQSTSTAQYQFGNSFYNTYRPDAYDPAIKWEETTTFNAGFDFGLLKDRITGSFDIYKRTTDDLINFIPVAGGSNLSNYLTTNVGSLENKGFEITLNSQIVQTNELGVNVGFNFTRNVNEITKLTTVDDPSYPGILVGGISGGVGNTIQNHQVGYPANSFYVFQQVYDSDGKPLEGVYVDRSGQGGSVTSNDLNRYRFKSPNPDFTFGINSTVTYKKFDFSFSGRASIGNYVYNNVLSDRARYTNVYSSTGGGFLNNVPKAIGDTEFLNAQYLSDYYVQDASFFRMDFISLGYSFNELLDQKLKARVGFTVRNAFVITDYSGIDPEVNGGIDNNIYPRPRMFMLSINLTY